MARRGNIAVTVALSLAVLLTFAAIVIDVGYGRYVALELQNAAEASAHAGSLQLDGTAEGVARAHEVAVEVAALNTAAGAPVVVDENAGNAGNGDVVTGAWEGGSFVVSTDPVAVNAVRVQPRIAALGLLVSPAAFGTAGVPVSARSVMVASSGGAGEVDCFVPLAIPECLIDTYGLDGLQSRTLSLNPPAIDTVGWGRPNGTPNASWSRDQILDCEQGGTAAVGDPVGLQNGVVTSAMAAMVTAVTTSTTTWDTGAWGAIPARMSGSSIPAASYGRTYEGVVSIFDGGPSYCVGSGGQFNGSETITAFMWAAVYDIKNSGSAASRTIKVRLDPLGEHDDGTGAGGPDYGVTATVAPRMVQ